MRQHALQETNGPGPETKPIKTSREVGEVEVGDLPLRILQAGGTKLQQFFDVILDLKLPSAEDVLEKVIYTHCAQGDYENLPAPFCLNFKSELPVPYLMQIVIVPTTTPENGDLKQTTTISSSTFTTCTKTSCQ